MTSTDPYAEFYATQDTAPADSGANLLLPPGYISAIDHTGQIVAVRVADQPAPTPVLPEPPAPESALEKALRLAREQPEPLPEQLPQAPQGLPPVYGQIVVLGSITMLAASGSAWILGAALAKAAPALPEVPGVLRWSLYLVIGLVAAVVAVRLMATTKTTQGGSQVTALVHREAHTHIERQSGGFWKGQINNKF